MNTIPAMQHKPRLPSEKDRLELTRDLGRSLESLSLLGYGMRAVIEPYMEGHTLPLVPTYEDLGRLYDFIHDLEADHWAIGQEIEGYKKSLDELLEVRREGTDA